MPVVTSPLRSGVVFHKECLTEVASFHSKYTTLYIYISGSENASFFTFTYIIAIMMDKESEWLTNKYVNRSFLKYIPD